MSTTTERERRRKRRPAHPGAILRVQHLEPLRMTVTKAADWLGVSRKTISKLINERGAVTPEMALRLGRAFDTTPRLWLNLQQSYDLWSAERESDWQRVRAIEVHAK